MAKLTVTARGQVTFRKDVLRHLSLKPGDQVEVDLLPDGRATLSAARPKGTFEDVADLLKGRTNGRVLSMDELDVAISEAGMRAGLGDGL
ncbi:transcriptional regulator [Rhizobium wuzhouense]|uniref:Transcriptional regulator n=2 Tax=Rhizobium wuzhouense TaxID=1986026 RepID=A0ABX5NUH2_9HYPH|nr:AbrB/MazE/SpoVT family DNA-binding domain-containing protein [Rhizobium wuzhouense]PYB75636.1 transcriptional regulator [Rhizobium wuzhouense]